MRGIVVFIFLLALMVIFFLPQYNCQKNEYGELFRYYIDNYYSETGATNAVTSIYLNYRIFDTMFEALMLLVSVLGVMYLSRVKGDEKL